MKDTTRTITTAADIMYLRRQCRATDDDIEKSEERREKQRNEQAQYELACENAQADGGEERE